MRKGICLFNVLLFLVMLILSPSVSMAAGTIHSSNEPTVRDIQSQELGTIRVELNVGSVKQGDVVIVQMPDFATFGRAFDPMVQSTFGNKVNRLVVPLNYDGKPIWDGIMAPFNIQNIEDDRLVIQSNVDQSLEQDYVFYIQLGDIDIEDGYYGPIQVSFEPSPESGFPSGDVSVGKVFGDKKTMDLKSSKFEQKDESFTFDLTIEENQAGAFEQNKSLKLKLPRGFQWNGFDKATMIKGQNANIKIEEVNGQELTLTLLRREGILQASSWKIPVSFRVSDYSFIQNGNITLKIQWDQSSDLTIGSYTKPKPKEYVIFKIGSSKYSVGNLEKVMDVAPYIKEGRTYLPVRYVAEVLGVDQDNIRWNGVTQTVMISKNSKVIQLKLASNVMNVDGKMMTMDTIVELKDNRLMLPIRYLTEAFGTPIIWFENEQSIKIEKK